MRHQANLLLGAVSVVLIGYGLATMNGMIQWPDQGGRSASAATFTFSVPCSSLSSATSSTTTITGATRVAVTARAGGCSSPLYQFWMLAPRATDYQLVQKYSSRSTFTWTPINVPPGPYEFAVWARDAGGDGATVTSLGRLDVSSTAGSFTVNACSAVGVTVGKSASTRAGEALDVVASAAGCGDPLYRFWVLVPGAGAYQMVQDYSPRPTLSWTTGGAAVGTYRIAVWARDRASAGVDGNVLGRWDASSTATYRVG